MWTIADFSVGTKHHVNCRHSKIINGPLLNGAPLSKRQNKQMSSNPIGRMISSSSSTESNFKENLTPKFYQKNKTLYKEEDEQSTYKRETDTSNNERETSFTKILSI